LLFTNYLDELDDNDDEVDDSDDSDDTSSDDMSDCNNQRVEKSTFQWVNLKQFAYCPLCNHTLDKTTKKSDQQTKDYIQ